MKNINITDFENVLFDIFPASREKYEIMYNDFRYDEYGMEVKTDDIPENVIIKISNPNDKTYPNVYGPAGWTKVGDMKPLIIDKKTLNINNGRFDDQIIRTLLLEAIEMYFFKKAEELGELNRICKHAPSTEKFDLNIPEFKKKDLVIKEMDENRVVLKRWNESESISRRILPQMIRCGSWIATNGRIGPGNYLIMNKSTHNYLEPYFEKLNGGYYKKEQFEEYYKSCKYTQDVLPESKNLVAKLSSFNIIVDDRVPDDKIIEGRKNGQYKIGINAVIWCNDDGDVFYEDRENEIELRYNVVDVGFFPWNQFYTIHLTREEN
jgi:hypothetical protein